MSTRVRLVLLWTAAGLAVANLIAFFAYTAPRAARKRDVAARTARLDSELTRQRAQVQDLRDRAETITANRKESRAFMDGQVAAVDASVVPVLTEVESLARKQGLHVGSQGFARTPVTGLPVERFGITMPVKGNYRQVTGLLGDLEASSTFVTLDRVSAGSQGDSTEQVSLDLEFSFYFRTGPGRGAGR
jgi:Tfp pilus assembly protein PilO